MTRYGLRTRALAACLSALAGYVDALAFIELGGFFVSFMSGNSTRLGVGLAHGGGAAAVAGGLIAVFVCGVVLGSITGRLAGAARRVAVLGLVTALLLIAATSHAAGASIAAVAAMALAMGAENAVFERDGEVSIGLTYMTGALVKLGQHLTAALFGGDRLAFAPYLFLWLGLVAGATLGAAVHPLLGLGGLWFAALAAGALTAGAAVIEARERRRG